MKQNLLTTADQTVNNLLCWVWVRSGWVWFWWSHCLLSHEPHRTSPNQGIPNTKLTHLGIKMFLLVVVELVKLQKYIDYPKFCFNSFSTTAAVFKALRRCALLLQDTPLILRLYFLYSQMYCRVSLLAMLFCSTRWRLDRPRVGRIWTPGNHECYNWANLRYLPGSHLLFARWDSVGIWVPSCRLPFLIRQICCKFCFLWQSIQGQDHAHL